MLEGFSGGLLVPLPCSSRVRQSRFLSRTQQGQGCHGTWTSRYPGPTAQLPVRGLGQDGAGAWGCPDVFWSLLLESLMRRGCSTTVLMWRMGGVAGHSPAPCRAEALEGPRAALSHTARSLPAGPLLPVAGPVLVGTRCRW